MAVVAPNASPSSVLRLVRGSITAARHAYPEVLHLEIQDPEGGLWRLATQDAEWSPADPTQLVDREVKSAELDEDSGELRFALSGETIFNVVPAEQETEDDPPNWKLFTPEGLVLVFGPGGHWQFNWAADPVGASRGQEMVAVDTLRGEALAQTIQREEIASLLNQRALRKEQFILALSVGLSVVSIAVAAISLALALR
jgi:hypothetical protein